MPAIFAAALIAAIGFFIVNPPRVAATYLDFNAFYCGARILAAHRDPYRYEPLHSCEIANLRPATPNAVVPAPLPPYAIAAFVPFSHLRYDRAQFVWWLLLLTSGLIILWVMVETTGLPMLLVASIVLGSALLPSLIVGSLALIPIALLSLSGAALLRQRWSAAALLQGAACVEPHVAFPVILTSFILVPAMRTRLACVAAAILAATLLAGRFALNAEYLTQVLPAHAVSEIGNGEQYGLGAVLHALGLGEKASAMIANVQYVLFAVGGVWLARAVRHALPAGVAFVPMALAVSGGPFVHVTQIAAALPLALAVAACIPSVIAWAGVALIAIAIPWQASIGFGGGVAALIVFAILAYNRIPRLGALAAAFIAGAVLTYLQLPELLHHQTIVLASISPNALAEVPWRQLADQFPPTAFSWYGHLLIYAGLACTYWRALRMARPRRQISAQDA